MRGREQYSTTLNQSIHSHIVIYLLHNYKEKTDISKLKKINSASYDSIFQSRKN